MMSRRFRWLMMLFAGALAVGLAGCSLAARAGSSSAQVAPGYAHVSRDIVYSTTTGQKMDLYFPKTAGPHPVIVWIHGGGWMNGSKDSQPLPDYIAEQVKRRSFVAVSIDYRLSGWTDDGTPINPFPDAVDDVKTAIRFLKAHASLFDIRPDMVLLSGQSAGGHLAALAGTSSAIGGLEPVDLPPDLTSVDDTVRAVIDVVGI